MQETTDSGVPNENQVVTKTGGSPPIFTEIFIVRENKSNIFVKGGSALVKHGTRLSISIISSQLGKEWKQRHPSNPNPPRLEPNCQVSHLEPGKSPSQ